ncbi:unnamed protein product [Rhizoctonia solani]|uniref:Jacalin-type lectin domain-containing protein n=1 Tax=Rhizoctonia solani TaxID=456999 RepID=A0A8H2XIY4_9AGAM|nr:unnamed protein product [Rhizoctonia solani]
MSQSKVTSGPLKSQEGTQIVGRFPLGDETWACVANFDKPLPSFNITAANLKYNSLSQLTNSNDVSVRIEGSTIEMWFGSENHIVGTLKNRVPQPISMSGQGSWKFESKNEPAKDPKSKPETGCPQGPGEVPMGPSTGTTGTGTRPTGPSTGTTGPSTGTTGPSTGITGPATTGPATTGPATTGPATTGPATTGPATTGPATTGPATTGPSGTRPTYSSGTKFNSKVVGKTPGNLSFENVSHGHKVVTSVLLRCPGAFIERIGLNYSDGTMSGLNPVDNPHGHTSTFDLAKDEHIVGILLCAGDDMYGAQFITSTGRISPLFGLTGGLNANLGTPTLLWENNAVLGAFNGTTLHYIRIRQLWATWRQEMGLINVPRLFPGQYNGVATGYLFNEHEFLGDSERGYVSNVTAYTLPNGVLYGLQFTHSHKDGNFLRHSEGNLRGLSMGASRQDFKLDEDEYIVKVSGTIHGWIWGISFVTNKGRSSPMFGKSGVGTVFQDTPPKGIPIDKPIGLKYVIGKHITNNAVYGLLCVWGVIE